jgi:hypothetical protein
MLLYQHMTAEQRIGLTITLTPSKTVSAKGQSGSPCSTTALLLRRLVASRPWWRLFWTGFRWLAGGREEYDEPVQNVTTWISAKQHRTEQEKTKSHPMGGFSFGNFCQRLTLEEAAEFLVELVHAAGGVNDLLLAGVERVALGANFDMEVVFAHGGLGHELVTAGAGNVHVGVIRMNCGFHCVSLKIGHRGFACTACKSTRLSSPIAGLTSRR